MKRLIALLMALLCLCSAACAESFAAAPAQQVQPTLITAVGSAAVNAPRDVALLTFTLVAESETASGAQQRMAELRVLIRDALGALNVTEIEENSYQLSALYDYEYGSLRSGEVIVGYCAQSEIVIRLNDIQSIGTVVDATILENGETTGHSLTFESSTHEQAHRDALALAVQEAMNSAEAMAGACGVKLGQLISVAEISASSAEASVEVTYTVE